MLRTVPGFWRRSAAVIVLSIPSIWTSTTPSSLNADRVASMLRAMYSASFSDSAGSTRRLWMTAG